MFYQPSLSNIKESKVFALFEIFFSFITGSFAHWFKLYHCFRIKTKLKCIRIEKGLEKLICHSMHFIQYCCLTLSSVRKMFAKLFHASIVVFNDKSSCKYRIVAHHCLSAVDQYVKTRFSPMLHFPLSIFPLQS